MASVASETSTERPDMVVRLHHITWADFETIARIKGDRRNPRLLFNQGTLTQVSPSQAHENGGDRLDRIVMAVCSELEIDCTPMGATLFRRLDLDKGLEGDETYYIAHEPAIRGKTVDLNLDPPPDLAVEVEVTNPSAEAVETWRLLGVPEVWVYRPRVPSLTILHLDDQARYAEAPASRAFPFLAAAEILLWVAQSRDEPESRWERRLRAWVRDELTGRPGLGEP